MTQSQRNKLEKLYSSIEEILADILSIKDDIEGKYDNMSEKIQEGENGEKLQAEISELDDLISDLESANEHIETAKTELE